MDCIFCKIVEGTIPSRKAYEDDRVVAFHDIEPQAPVHTLVIPKKHFASLNECEPADFELLGHALSVCKQIARDSGIAESGYRVVNNIGNHAGQVVHHFHFHVLGGEKLAALNPKTQK